MSLVGPRPLILDEDRARRRLGPEAARPQARDDRPLAGARRLDIPFGEMVQLDYLYVPNWSLWRDVLLLVRTGAVVLRGLAVDGAFAKRRAA